MDVRRHIQYPVKNEHGRQRFALVSGLVFISVALGELGGLIGILAATIPATIALGIILEVLAPGADGAQRPIRVGRLRKVLRDGLRGLFVLLLYSLVPVGVLLGGQLALFELVGGDRSVAGLPLLVISTIIIFSIGVFLYLLPAALTRATTTSSLYRAFDGRVRKSAVSLRYLINWLTSTIAFIIGANVAGFILFTTGRVGGLVAIPLIVYVTITCSHTIGKATDGQ